MVSCVLCMVVHDRQPPPHTTLFDHAPDGLVSAGEHGDEEVHEHDLPFSLSVFLCSESVPVSVSVAFSASAPLSLFCASFAQF
jgi:hypothetical protein